MKFALRILLISSAALAHSAAPAQEKLDIPPTPTQREHLTREQIRRDWVKLCSKSRSDAVSILKRMQGRDGGWESLRDRWGGETDALVIESLLDNDVPRHDPVIINGLRNLRLFRPATTHVVALQTVVLCKVNETTDRELIEHNVAWLLKALHRDGKQFRGWGLTDERARSPYDTYTFYAVMALRSAQTAGIDFDRQIWAEIRDFYFDHQREDGGWRWITQPGPESSPLPTVMALYALYAVDEQIGESPRSSWRIRKGVERLVESGSFSETEAPFFLYAMSRLGQLHGELKLCSAAGKERQWFEDGTVWAMDHRMDSGSFFVARQSTAKTTATCLLFLAAGK
jgi:hypothetical protein